MITNDTILATIPFKTRDGFQYRQQCVGHTCRRESLIYLKFSQRRVAAVRTIFA